jgi:hypothetical protein
MTDREPNFELKVWLSETGFQADIFFDGKPILGYSRSWGDKRDIKEVQRWSRIQSIHMLNMLHGKDWQ